ncbi:MAG: glycerophosphodiester phosphodiesterase family protein [Agriterribacter sp.]
MKFGSISYSLIFLFTEKQVMKRKEINSILASIGMLLIIVLLSCTKKITTTAMSVTKNIVVAHRGAWKKNNLPENSIASLHEAIRQGCAGSEFDVHITIDDSLVINHDNAFGGMPIETTTYAELAATKLSNGEMLPTLRQYLLAGMHQQTTKLVLEIKPSTTSKEHGIYATEKIVALVQELKAEPWIMYISFDYDIVKKVKALQPQANVAHLNGDKTPQELKMDNITGADYNVGVYKKNPEWITEAKKAGIELNAWTVNTKEDMQWLIDNKFDYITTNEPELLFELIKK